MVVMDLWWVVVDGGGDVQGKNPLAVGDGFDNFFFYLSNALSCWMHNLWWGFGTVASSLLALEIVVA